MDDHYEALGLEQTATPEEIKKAFKQLALKYHPDQHPSPIANAIFRTLNEAYLVLSDPEKRRAYDEELRRRRAAPRGRRAAEASAPKPPPAEKSEGAPAQDGERARREAVQRRDFARARAKQVRGVSEKSVRETDESMRDLYVAAEADVEAEERRERDKRRKR